MAGVRGQKNNVNIAHRREKKSGGIGDYILN
jgi:hypothetical protein